ncbi:(2Fe-2S)-binding protein [Miltoncostaea marina]|uniref:(2Fe-2S)-binding protein n=1 Tax=Miltoncostaea marina TaxID=2843215 RepID=UPI001C3E5571|nr:(2Fe-2S)-binding protein [Miltoncostaea marina]
MATEPLRALAVAPAPAAGAVRLDLDHPLNRAIRRLGATRVAEHLPPGLRAGAFDDHGWLRREDLLGAATLDLLTAAVASQAGCDDPRLTGTLLLEGYAWQLAAPALGLLLAAGRLPDIDPATLYVRLADDGRVEALAYASGRFATLEDDPEAGHPDATTFADDHALLAWFRRALVRHLEPVVEAVAPRARRGRRALWRSVEDCCSGAMTWIGDELGDGDGARARAGLLLGVEEPLGDPPCFEVIGEDPGAPVVRRRIGCCQSFRAPGGALCPTCPRARVRG